MADSKILLPVLIDNLAASEPDKLFCAYAESIGEADMLHKVSYKTFANAVNACAWWLQDTLGEGVDFETIAYLGPSDIQPAILTLAAAKVNRKVRCPSHAPQAHMPLKCSLRRMLTRCRPFWSRHTTALRRSCGFLTQLSARFLS